ncbi:hypothetical protein ANO11243_050340 [Dothideomycetidae sp. 11243]|nr:hypothetical protein ANO11243_050340 [fungal sp. No.11243]
MSASSKRGLLAVMGTLTALSTIAVGLRLVARKKQRLPFKADDAFAVLALLMFIGAVACECEFTTNWPRETRRGPSRCGRRLDNVIVLALTDHRAPQLALTWDVLAAAASAFIKLSALFFYRRLFVVPGIRRPFDVASAATIALVGIWLIVYIIMPFVQCGTHTSILFKAGLPQYCKKPQKGYYISLVTSNFVLDLWILLLPIPSVLRLHTTTSKKISLVGVFLLAFTGLGASVARMVIYIEILTGHFRNQLTYDPGRAQTRAAYLTHLESGIALVAVNLPSLWLLCTKIVPEKALQSVRSMLSLNSIRSNRSDNAVKDPSITKRTDVTTHPSESSTALHPAMPQGMHGDSRAYSSEVYAMKKMDA